MMTAGRGAHCLDVVKGSARRAACAQRHLPAVAIRQSRTACLQRCMPLGEIGSDSHSSELLITGDLLLQLLNISDQLLAGVLNKDRQLIVLAWAHSNLDAVWSQQTERIVISILSGARSKLPLRSLLSETIVKAVVKQVEEDIAQMHRQRKKYMQSDQRESVAYLEE